LFCRSVAYPGRVRRSAGRALTINGLGRLAFNEQQYTLAGERFGQALHLFYQLGNKVDIADCLEELALIAAGTGDGERAATLWAAGEALRQEIRVYTLIYNQRLAAPMLAQIDAQQMAAARAAVQFKRKCSLRFTWVRWRRLEELLPQRTRRAQAFLCALCGKNLLGNHPITVHRFFKSADTDLKNRCTDPSTQVVRTTCVKTTLGITARSPADRGHSQRS